MPARGAPGPAIDLSGASITARPMPQARPGLYSLMAFGDLHACTGLASVTMLTHRRCRLSACLELCPPPVVAESCKAWRAA